MVPFSTITRNLLLFVVEHISFYVGIFLDVTLIELFYKIIMLLLQLETHGSNLTEEQLETHTISAWKEAKRQTYGRHDGQWRPHQPLVHVSWCLFMIEN